MNFNELLKFILNKDDEKEKQLNKINEHIENYKKTNDYKELE